jgi:methylated-DNA-[protein]-cysteine S-methyltransferase
LSTGTALAISFYILVPSPFGAVALLYREMKDGPRVQSVLLPMDDGSAEERLQLLQADTYPGSCPEMVALGQRITGFLEGQDVVFPLSGLALDTCPEFQRRVLEAEHRIPRSWVSTYGRIAQHLDTAGGARAVGNALAKNPFPILIPCHRAIRANGELGGYQGGLKMKQALLELEGVQISPAGRVLTDRIYY